MRRVCKMEPVRGSRLRNNGYLESRDSEPAQWERERDVQRWAQFHKQGKQLELLKLKDEGWSLHLWEHCNLGDPQLVPGFPAP